MEELIQHGFIYDHVKKQLALAVAEFPNDPTGEPSLLVSPDEPIAYLYRGGDETHVLDEIDPKIIGKLRDARSVLVMEADPNRPLDAKDSTTLKRVYNALVTVMDRPLGKKKVEETTYPA